MITIAGFNTAIDRFVRIEALRPGDVQRALEERVTPGGKGLHVAQTIAALGERVQLIGLVDAAHRNLIARRMSERGVLFHGVEIDDDLRQCLAIQDANGQITEVLGQGPMLESRQCDALLQAFHRSIEDSELMILSGSLPRGLPPTTYADLIEQARHAGVRCLVDASGEALRHAVQAKPFLIKPNRDEVGELCGQSIDDLDAAVDAVRRLRDAGVILPVVTLGALGALAGGDSGFWHASLALPDVRNSVGSGDCLLAGMVVGMARGMNIEDGLRLGVACGAANAQGEETGFVEQSKVKALLPQVRLRRLA